MMRGPNHKNLRTHDRSSTTRAGRLAGEVFLPPVRLWSTAASESSAPIKRLRQTQANLLAMRMPSNRKVKAPAAINQTTTVSTNFVTLTLEISLSQ